MSNPHENDVVNTGTSTILNPSRPVPDRLELEVSRWGIPLGFWENLSQALVIALAGYFQLRFPQNILSEGLMLLFGVIAALVLRWWMVGRWYQHLDPLVVEPDRVCIPACLNYGQALDLRFGEVHQAVEHLFRSEYGNSLQPSSFTFRDASQTIKVTSLAIELEPLEKALVARGLYIERQVWTGAWFGGIALLVMLVTLLGYILFLAMR